MSPTLASGTTLRHYEIGALLGSGGMGEVYEARDLALERRVALKILSPDLHWGAGITQFVREAKKASALHHPHILTVHEIGEQEVNGDHIHYMAMELVEGVTLRREIYQQRAPLRRLLEVLTQVADALAKAHESGIVHRDLKPENIMVTADGYAKIIDFGLAKLLAPLGGAGGDSDALTLTAPRHLMGTVGYMAPEQVRQKEVDGRADIFAFGCIVYEAVTRERAFKGDNAVDVLHNICHQAPVPVEDLVPEVPEALRMLIGRCLEKSPENRYRSMQEVALDLRGVVQMLSSRSIPTVLRSERAVRAVPPRARWRRWWIGAAALAVAAAIAIPTALLLRRRPAAVVGTPVMRPLVRWPSFEDDCRFSPDGAWVTFISDRGNRSAIWLRRTSGGEPSMLIAPAEELDSQVWSPSGDEIAYITAAAAGRVLHFTAPFGGGSPDSSALDGRVPDAHLVRWIGPSLYIESRGELWRFDRKSRALTAVAGGGPPGELRNHYDIRTDEKRITYSAVGARQYQTIWIADIDGGHAVCLTPEQGARFSDFRSRFASDSEDDLVFSSDRSGQIDLWRLDAGGTARQITFSPAIEWIQDVARGGAVLAFSEKRNSSNLWLAPAEEGEPRQLTAEAGADFWPSASARVEAIAFQRTRPTLRRMSDVADADIYVSRLSGGHLADPRIAVEDAFFPTIAPQGRWLTYARPGAPNQYELWLKDLESDRAWRIADRFRLGAHYPVPLERLETNVAWSASGHAVYFVTIVGERKEIQRVDPATRSAATVVRAGAGADLHDPRPSPDGRHLAYLRRAAGRSDLVVRELSTGRETTLFSQAHDAYQRVFCPGWTSDATVIVVWATVNPDSTERLQTVQLAADGKRKVTPLAERGYGGTARLDPASASLLLTTVDADGSQALSRVFLDSNRTSSVAHRPPGISCGGIVPLPDHTVLFSSQESNSDLWLIDVQNK